MKHIKHIVVLLAIFTGCSPNYTEQEAKTIAEQKFPILCGVPYDNYGKLYCQTNEFTGPKVSITSGGNKWHDETYYEFTWDHKTKNIRASIGVGKNGGDIVKTFGPIDQKQPIGVVLKEEKPPDEK